MERIAASAKGKFEESTQLHKNWGEDGDCGAHARVREELFASRSACGEVLDQAAAAVLARTINSAGIVSRILALPPTSISLSNSCRLRRPISA